MDTYEKKYKEANDKVAARFGTNVAKEIFTDLYESEDERIRKAIIEYLRQRLDRSPSIPAAIGSWIAWLEKQGEISPILSNSSNIGKNAWSEEDEEHYKACLQYFDAVNPDMVYYKDYQWLKSLKERIGG